MLAPCSVASMRFTLRWKLLEENDHNLANITFNGKEQGEELFSRSDSLGCKWKRRKERSKRWKNVFKKEILLLNLQK